MQYDACAGCGHIRRSHTVMYPLAAPSGAPGCQHCSCLFWQEPTVRITGDIEPMVKK